MLIAHILRDKGRVIHAAPIDATLEEAALELTKRRVGALVVLDEHGRMQGVLSERDIIRQVAQRGAAALLEPVSAAMTRTVITARPNETIDEGLGRMTDRRIRHLPVLHEGELIGVVSIGDLVAAKINETVAEAEAMRAYIMAS